MLSLLLVLLDVLFICVPCILSVLPVAFELLFFLFIFLLMSVSSFILSRFLVGYLLLRSLLLVLLYVLFICVPCILSVLPVAFELLFFLFIILLPAVRSFSLSRYLVGFLLMLSLLSVFIDI